MPSEQIHKTKLRAVHKFKEILGCYHVKEKLKVSSLQHNSLKLAQNLPYNTITS